MEKLRSPLPLVPRREDAPRAAAGNELRDDLPAIRPTRAFAIVELKRRLPFWRDPRRQFVVMGAQDAPEAVGLAVDAKLAIETPEGYGLARIEAHPFDDASFIVTLTFAAATGH